MYQAIEPGYHMSKIHWNTVFVNRDLPQKLPLELIDHSYDLIVESLPKTLRQTLETK